MHSILSRVLHYTVRQLVNCIVFKFFIMVKSASTVATELLNLSQWALVIHDSLSPLDIGKELNL